jgi:hypothetical protein
LGLVLDLKSFPFQVPTKFGFKIDDPEEFPGIIVPELEEVELQKSASGSKEVPVRHIDVQAPSTNLHSRSPLFAGHFAVCELLQRGLLFTESQSLQNGESV